MARGFKQPELRQSLLSLAQMQDAIPRIDRRIADIDAFDIASVISRSDPRIDVLSSKLDALLVAVFGVGTVEYERYRWLVTQIDTAPINMAYPTPILEVRDGLARGLAAAKAQLEAIKSSFLEEIEDAGPAVPGDTTGQQLIANEFTGIHPEILKKCSDLLEKRAYPETVERSFKIVRDRLRQLTGFETGSDAFGKGRLHILGAAAPHVDADFNQGAKFLMMAIDMFRNEKSHTSEGNVHDAEHAPQYLMLSSLALRFLDRAEIQS
jgi:uncharacterized protein (TIGR02391 family)